MYSVKDRQIYRWHDGNQERWADPVDVYRKLVRVQGLYQHLETIGNYYVAAASRPFQPPEERSRDDFDQLEKHAQEGMAELVPVALDAFQTKQFDGNEGLLEHEVINLVRDFLHWTVDVKKTDRHGLWGGQEL